MGGGEDADGYEHETHAIIDAEGVCIGRREEREHGGPRRR
jgi:hypothetical protein